MCVVSLFSIVGNAIVKTIVQTYANWQKIVHSVIKAIPLIKGL